jgi:hypothetical protein
MQQQDEIKRQAHQARDVLTRLRAWEVKNIGPKCRPGDPAWAIAQQQGISAYLLSRYFQKHVDWDNNREWADWASKGGFEDLGIPPAEELWGLATGLMSLCLQDIAGNPYIYFVPKEPQGKFYSNGLVLYIRKKNWNNPDREYIWPGEAAGQERSWAQEATPELLGAMAWFLAGDRFPKIQGLLHDIKYPTFGHHSYERGDASSFDGNIYEYCQYPNIPSLDLNHFSALHRSYSYALFPKLREWVTERARPMMSYSPYNVSAAPGT